jgi:hypothetical protein
MGGKNPFLGIAYLVVGGLCIVLGALFTVTYIVKPRYVYQLMSLQRQQHDKSAAPNNVPHSNEGIIYTNNQIPRKLGDHTYLTWNNEQPATATATGRSLRPGSDNNNNS